MSVKVNSRRGSLTNGRSGGENQHDGVIFRLNDSFRSGSVQATSSLPPRCQSDKFFFRVAEENSDIFAQISMLQPVKFKIDFSGPNQNPVVTELIVIHGNIRTTIPIEAQQRAVHNQSRSYGSEGNNNGPHSNSKQNRNKRPDSKSRSGPKAALLPTLEYSLSKMNHSKALLPHPKPGQNVQGLARAQESNNSQKSHQKQKRQHIQQQESAAGKRNQRENATNSNNIKPLMETDSGFNQQRSNASVPAKHSAMTGTIVAVKNVQTDKPYGFIQPDEQYTDTGLQAGIKFDFKNVKPFGVNLKRHDKVKFILLARPNERFYATRVYIQGLNTDRSSKEIEQILENMHSCVSGSDIDNTQSDVLINVLGCREIWKCIGDCKSLDGTGIILLMELLNKVQIISTGLSTSFKSIIETLAYTNLLNHHNGPLADLIGEATSDNDQDLLVKIRAFLLLIADNVPAKITAISALVKPMLTSDKTSMEFFLWRTLKASVRSKDTLAEDQEWHELPLVPSPHEMLQGPQEGAFNLQPAKQRGAYASAEEYIDINFRLLRADCFNALNKGIRSLLEGNLDHRDMNAYHSLKLHGIRLCNHDSPLTIAFNITPLKPVRNWEKARNLMYGNLVCISVSGTFQDPIWATVSSRDLLPKLNIVMLELCSECNQQDDGDAITMLQYADYRSVMVESPTYYKSYQPVLQSLQRITPEKIPFQQEIVEGGETERPPFYDETSTVDAGVIYSNYIKEDSDIAVDDFCSRIPGEIDTSLDISQERALLECLTKRVAIIQGPPGTGKTYIGAKLVHLLNTMSKKPRNPILVLTYKNHALDEFMKEMSEEYPTGIVRLGGRSTALGKYNLSELKRTIRKPDALYDQSREYRSEMEQIEKGVMETSKEIKVKMQLNFYMFLTYASSEQLISLLRECNWNALRIPSMNPKQPNPGEFQEVRRKNKAPRYVDKKEVHALLSNIYVPLKECIACADYVQKAPVLTLLNAAFHAWLPSRYDFNEVRTSLYTTVSADLSKLSVCVKEEQEEQEEEEDDSQAEHVRAELNERMAAMGVLKGDKVTMENIIQLGADNSQIRDRNMPVIFPIPKEHSNDVFRTYVMSKEDLWSMSTRERVLYVQNMLHMEFSNCQAYFKELLTKYKNLHKRKSELDIIHSVNILRDKKVIGMTITGASIHGDLIKQLKPEILLVEEAAEVMEPQILSTLGPWVQQIILIGDQKQLRPNVESFEMRKYNLDISLMERLINNNLQYSQLELQNRMRPEFAELLMDIYPGLRSNLARVTNNKKPACAAKAMYFWTHREPEQSGTNTSANTPNKGQDVQSLGRSYRNEEEAERCIKLALFFIQQGHLPCDITILAAYLGQAHLLRRKLREAQKKHDDIFAINRASVASRHAKYHEDNDFDAGRVVIQTIDNYQGDENEIVIVSLVRSNDKGKTGFLNTLNRRCVAQSRAKCAMYFIGDDNTIQSSRHWQPLLTAMREIDCLGSYIPLQCPDHPEVQIHPRDSTDITLRAFCTEICDKEMPCSIHKCDNTCQPKHRHERCTQMVHFKFYKCGHPGVRQCFQPEITMKCLLPVEFIFPCEHPGNKICYEDEKDKQCKAKLIHTFLCGHTRKRQCYQDPKKLICMEKVPFNFSACDHIGMKACSEDETKRKCEENVPFTFPCGHLGKKLCHQDETAYICKQKVKFTFPCGHPGERLCHEPVETIVCKARCTKQLPKCDHICSRLCSEPCSQENCEDCRRIAEAKEKQQREEEKRKRIEMLQQVNAEIACLKTQKMNSYKEELKYGNVEYDKVQNMVLKCIQPMHNWYPKINRIVKIHNPELHLSFLQRKRSLFDPTVCQEKFYGANATETKKIERDGFNIEGSKGQNRHLFGPGLYFTSDSSTSAQEKYTMGSSTILLCDVLLGKAYSAEQLMKNMDGKKLRDKKFDSLFAKRGTDPQIKEDLFVVYNAHQALPKYAIHYTKKEVQIRPIENLTIDTEKQQQKYEMHMLKEKRDIDYNDPLDLHFRIVESQFHRLRGKFTQRSLPDIDSIEYHINPPLVEKFEAKEKEFKKKYKQGKGATSVLAFHGTSPQNIHSITQNNFEISRIERAIHGFGVYFSEFPVISNAYGKGLLLCRVLPGKSFKEKEKRVEEIPDGFDSIIVKPDEKGRGEMIVIANPDQILPCYVIHLQKEEDKNTEVLLTNPTTSDSVLKQGAIEEYVGNSENNEDVATAIKSTANDTELAEFTHKSTAITDPIASTSKSVSHETEADECNEDGHLIKMSAAKTTTTEVDDSTDISATGDSEAQNDTECSNSTLESNYGKSEQVDNINPTYDLESNTTSKAPETSVNGDSTVEITEPESFTNKLPATIESIASTSTIKTNDQEQDSTDNSLVDTSQDSDSDHSPNNN